MLGKFCAWAGDEAIAGLEARKVQELICYLLLFRQRPHRREILADALWGGISTAQSKKYLRHALWRLHSVLDEQPLSPGPTLLIDAEWIQVNEGADLWVDVAEVEAAFAAARGTPGEQLQAEAAARLEKAIQLYRGELLEGWYQDWCVFERERLKTIYLAMVEKLLGFHEITAQFDEALLCGDRILRIDHAHERTHYRLMRLRYLAGDRTGALRQYQACACALREELGVEPSERTVRLFERIRADGGVDVPPRPRSEVLRSGEAAPTSAPRAPAAALADRLQHTLDALIYAEKLVQQALRSLHTN